MWKTKLPSGKVQYAERYIDPLTGKAKKVTVTMVPTGRKSDDKSAEKILQKKIDDVLSKMASPENITFKELTRRRVEWQYKYHKIQTAASSEHYLSTLSKLIGDETLVDKLTAPIVTDRLASDSAVTYNERLKHYKSLMRWGYRNDLVNDISYLDKLQRMKEPPVREKDKYKYLEKNEITLLLDRMQIEKWRLLTEFLILSGLRIGEAMALNDKDVDIKKREIVVNKTYAYHVHQTSSTKTDMSDRVVFMQDELVSCAKKIKSLVRKEKVKFAFRSDLFIPDVNTGSFFTYETYAKYLRENTAAILGRPLSPHALRHTHTSMLAEAGVPLETISRRLGHANSKITREIYLHVTEKMKDRDNALIDKVSILE